MRKMGCGAGAPMVSALGMVMSFGVANANAQTVWSGLDYSFTKAPFADWTLEENQDRITDNVWITRADTQGIFNIASETGFTHFVSPADTEWATGAAADWESLTFQTWETWAGAFPPGTVDVDAVVHLISDDIYLDIRFTEWAIGGGAGGAFSYMRATPKPLQFDFDGDGDVDLDDYAAMAECLQGPGTTVDETCTTFDADIDNDVDLADFAVFMVHFTGGVE